MNKDKTKEKINEFSENVKTFWKQNSTHLVTSIIVSVVTLLITTLATSDASFFVYAGIIYIFLALFFLQQYKIVFDKRFSKVHNTLIEYFGWAARNNDYYRRKQHFVDEKQLLAKTLVEKCLPALLQTETIRARNIKNINIFLDAGTAIAEIFPLIVSKGINIPFSASINIYTNNLAGIIELHRKGDPKSYVLKEENIHLLGGQPLYDYQAVTGKETEKAIKSICRKKDTEEKEDLSSITIGIITANWIMSGVGLDEIRLAARGNGHLAIKETIIKYADYIYIIAPLAKIIRTHDLKTLNEIVPHNDKYEEYRIDADKRETTFLLTTKRATAPLNITTIALSSCINDNNNKNYKVSEYCPDHRISGTKEEIEVQEFPQDYIRSHKDFLYNINS